MNLTIWLRLLTSTCLCVLLVNQSFAGNNNFLRGDGSSRVKVIVNTNTPEEFKTNLTKQGAVRLVDYGAFSLWQAPPAYTTMQTNGETGITVQADIDRIWLRGGKFIDGASGTEPDMASNLRQSVSSGHQLRLVQFIGPIKDAWLTNLKQAGLEIVSYMPNNAYVVWGDSEVYDRLSQLAKSDTAIQWIGDYHPAYRLSPQLTSAIASGQNGLIDVTVQFYRTDAIKQTLSNLQSISGKEYSAAEDVLGFTNISLQLPVNSLVEIVSRSDVFNIEPWTPPVMFDEVQGQIIAGNIKRSSGKIVPSGPGYLSFLSSKGFPTTQASYPIVDIVDDGIDQGNAASVLHPDFFEFGATSNPARVSYIGNCTTDTNGNGVGGHGNLNAGIVGSYNNLTGTLYQDVNGYRIGLGISPYGRIAGTKIFANSGSWSNSKCGNTYAGLVQQSYASGATFTSNSWGAKVYGAYTASSQSYDALTRDASSVTTGVQQMLHIFSAGNDGSYSNTIGSPGTAKNVLTVGATENVREQGVSDGCVISYADNGDDIAVFSSRGPTDDGRIKPDIVAPGTHIQGPASQDPGYNGNGVCNKYHPSPGQTLYAWSSGTSHSAPAVAGAASLAYENYGRVINPGNVPSPAMLKALLLNSTRYLNAATSGGNLPTNNQGWGEVDLGKLFNGASMSFYDQRSADIFDSTGQTRTFTGSIMNPGQPFRITLVWTDAPGTTSGNAYVNDLNLEVTVGGNTYKGNVFSGASSITGGLADGKNNVESVFLETVRAGDYTVRVTAANIAGDGIPGNADATDQDFALVISNYPGTQQSQKGLPWLWLLLLD